MMQCDTYPSCLLAGSTSSIISAFDHLTPVQASLVLMLCCQSTLFIAPALRTVLYGGPVVAIAFGGVFSMVPSLVSLLYGMPHFGQNWVPIIAPWF